MSENNKAICAALARVQSFDPSAKKKRRPARAGCPPQPAPCANLESGPSQIGTSQPQCAPKEYTYHEMLDRIMKTLRDHRGPDQSRRLSLPVPELSPGKGYKTVWHNFRVSTARVYYILGDIHRTEPRPAAFGTVPHLGAKQ